MPETSRNVRVFGFTSLLNDTASEMAYWVLPAFLGTLGAGPEQLGIIEGIAESVASHHRRCHAEMARDPDATLSRGESEFDHAFQGGCSR